jgi:hypothetical protein
LTAADEQEIDKAARALVPVGGCQHGNVDDAAMGGVRISAITALRIRELIYDLAQRVRVLERKAETT